MLYYIVLDLCHQYARGVRTWGECLISVVSYFGLLICCFVVTGISDFLGSRYTQVRFCEELVSIHRVCYLRCYFVVSVIVLL